ncbi:MAG: hypothetical protein M0R80_26125 [Proteobacteria bacterium]|jgi:hypothetical protein|nr:hypothetical protein [Pseudomonadota bacterium]
MNQDPKDLLEAAHLVLDIEGLTEEDAKLAIELARRIAARSFARGFREGEKSERDE